MANVTRYMHEGQVLELPPGFRFHPTDEELIICYLTEKVLDNNFSARAIGEVDLNKCEPWDLPRIAKIGEREWYFFCVRDKKYPTGHRTNRATIAGYWKATGKDKDIMQGKTLIGMKKTLVFYKGRAPKGEKTNWVMHEYRLEGPNSMNNLAKTSKEEWAICRVFQKKSSCGRRVLAAGFETNSPVIEYPPIPFPFPPPAPAPYKAETMNNAVGESSYVTTFSGPNQTEDMKAQDVTVDSMETPMLAHSYASWAFANTTLTPPPSPPTMCNPLSAQLANQVGNHPHYPGGGGGYFMNQDQSMMSMLIDDHGSSKMQDNNNNNQKAVEESDFDADITTVMYNNAMIPPSFGNQGCSSAYLAPHVNYVNNGYKWNV